ncbi:uncharacterized protein LOC123266363 [Cotesia glomerata]|uniref:uncharacterized protein LOC123266363 n=1 Tax=Cotesia glomerata TaxID=32391 RepID=UPI001D026923|nr:uncharacterized protein LOC123266363 [Cotesia glomerata]
MHASMIDMFEGMAEEIVILQTEDPTNKLLLRTEERIKEDSTNVTKEKVDQHLHINDNDSPSIQHDNNSNTKPVAHKSDYVIPSKKFIPITSNVIQDPPLSVHALKNNQKNANNLAAQQLNSNNGKAKSQQTKPGTSPKDHNNYQYQRIENLIVTSLRRIDEKQNERMDNLENMLRQREPMVANAPRNNNIGNHNPRPPGFPITSLDEYNAYEDDDDNQESQNQLRQYLAQEEAGSSNCKDSIRKFYYHTFSPSIFKKLQWTSHNLKNRPEMRGLFNSKISNVFFEAIHECQHDKRLTSDEFSKHMTAAIEAGKQSLRDSHKRNQRNNPAPRRSCATAIKAKYGRFDENARMDANDED